MKLYDQHVHSEFSFDSAAEMEDVCRCAIERGLAGITFTDHLDTHPTEWPGCTYDHSAQRAQLDVLRDTFGGELWIGHGIEVCYQPERMEFILDYLSRHEFDVVLLSVHWMRGRAVHSEEHWGELSCAQGTRLYLETVRDAARLCVDEKRAGRRPFDVLGHLDFAKRYTLDWWGQSAIEECRDVVDQILATCVEAELIPEINTSPLRNGLSEPMPAAWIVHRYAELGGRCMAVGSDAHRSQQVGADLDRAAALLRSAGLDGQAVFKARERRIEPV